MEKRGEEMPAEGEEEEEEEEGDLWLRCAPQALTAVYLPPSDEDGGWTSSLLQHKHNANITVPAGPFQAGTAKSLSEAFPPAISPSLRTTRSSSVTPSRRPFVLAAPRDGHKHTRGRKTKAPCNAAESTISISNQPVSL